MNAVALDAFVAQERGRATLTLALDEALGTHHGIGWPDFLLLQALQDATQAVPDQALAVRLGLPRSLLLLRLRPLDKLGLVQRSEASGTRCVHLSSGGRRVLGEARDTAAAVCAQAAGG